MCMMPVDRCKVPSAFWRAVERIGYSPPAVLRRARLPPTLHPLLAADEAWERFSEAMDAIIGDSDGWTVSGGHLLERKGRNERKWQRADLNWYVGRSRG